MKIIRLLEFSLLNFIWVLANIIPKKKNVWLFGAWEGKRFSDNPRYIFEEAVKRNINAYWITKCKNIHNELKENKRVIYSKSIKSIILHMRAEVVVFSHSLEADLIASLVAKRTKKVLTWHGIPIKKIGYDDGFFQQAKRRISIYSILWPYRNDKVDLVFTAGEYDKNISVNAFNVKRNNVIITGYPRNDLLTCNNSFEEKIKIKRRILYAPTLRGAPYMNSKFIESLDIKNFDKKISELDYEMAIRFHPAQHVSERLISEIRKSKSLKYLHNNPKDETNKIIKEYDILITDYSGIYFDYLLLNRPIIVAAIDLEEYLLESRSMYMKIEEFAILPICKDWDHVFSQLSNISNCENDIKEVIENKRRRFHRYVDSKSSQRCLEIIQKKLAGEQFDFS